MSDMLVRLYALPEAGPALERLARQSIHIRRAEPGETRTIGRWVGRHFSETLAAACEWAVAREPIACYLAVERSPAPAAGGDAYPAAGGDAYPAAGGDAYAEVPRERLIGVACFDTAGKGLFGPLGVDPAYRGRSVGRALLLVTLKAMRDERYAYAVIGWAGEPDFYRKAARATEIADSEPGVFGVRLAAGGPESGEPESGEPEAREP